MNQHPPTTASAVRHLASTFVNEARTVVSWRTAPARDRLGAVVVALGFMIATKRSRSRWRIAFLKGSGQPVPDELYRHAGLSRPYVDGAQW